MLWVYFFGLTKLSVYLMNFLTHPGIINPLAGNAL